MPWGVACGGGGGTFAASGGGGAGFGLGPQLWPEVTCEQERRAAGPGHPGGGLLR